jgi:hypothetical protein
MNIIFKDNKYNKYNKYNIDNISKKLLNSLYNAYIITSIDEEKLNVKYIESESKFECDLNKFYNFMNKKYDNIIKQNGLIKKINTITYDSENDAFYRFFLEYTKFIFDNRLYNIRVKYLVCMDLILKQMIKEKVAAAESAESAAESAASTASSEISAAPAAAPAPQISAAATESAPMPSKNYIKILNVIQECTNRNEEIEFLKEDIKYKYESIKTLQIDPNPNKKTLIIIVHGIGAQIKENITYKHDNNNYYLLFAYDSNGILSDIKNVIGNSTSLKFNFNNAKGRSKKLSILIENIILKGFFDNIEIICMSHGTLVTHRAILLLKINNIDTEKIRIFAMSAPRYLPKDLVKKCVYNAYHEEDHFMTIFKLGILFKIPKITEADKYNTEKHKDLYNFSKINAFMIKKESYPFLIYNLFEYYNANGANGEDYICNKLSLNYFNGISEEVKEENKKIKEAIDYCNTQTIKPKINQEIKEDLIKSLKEYKEKLENKLEKNNNRLYNINYAIQLSQKNSKDIIHYKSSFNNDNIDYHISFNMFYPVFDLSDQIKRFDYVLYINDTFSLFKGKEDGPSGLIIYSIK